MGVSVDDRHDIETADDVEVLVRAFYARALDDVMIGWLFTDVAGLDLEAHLPRIQAFWETMLLGAGSYGGGAFAPHAVLHRKAELKAAHFERWLELWRSTIDERFAGERADLAKHHATRVAGAFHSRLQSIPTGSVPTGPAPLSITRH